MGVGSGSNVFSIPVRYGATPRKLCDDGCVAAIGRAGTICAVTTGFAARRCSNSFCIFLRARSSRQSWKRSQSAIAKAKRVGAHTCNAENENAVVKYRATANTEAQTM